MASDPIVIHCSDPHYQPYFQDFLKTQLKLPRYALLAVPGGAQFLTLTRYLPKFSWVGSRFTKFLVDLTKARRIILIAHADCHWYLHPRFLHQQDHIPERQANDLRHVSTAIRERWRDVTVETYWARMDNDVALFETIA